MDQSIEGQAAHASERGGTTRRNVLLGAGTLAAATAVVSAMGGGIASAAEEQGWRCSMPGIGDFAMGSVQWGAGVAVGSAAGGGRTASAPSISEMTCTKTTDTLSPKLFTALVTGQVSDPVTITLVGPKGETTTVFTLEDVLVSGFSMSSGGDVPSESLSLNFTAIKVSVNGVSAGYSLEDGRPY